MPYILPVAVPIASMVLATIALLLWSRLSRDYTFLPVALATAWMVAIYVFDLLSLISDVERMAMVRAGISIMGIALSLSVVLNLYGERLWPYLVGLGANLRGRLWPNRSTRK